MNTEDNKEEFHYFNDEWNKKESYQWVDVRNVKFEQLQQGKITLSEYFEFINQEQKLIKNDKPDGRRYKK